MLPLDSPAWAELTHIYGKAADVPGLLRELEGSPSQPVIDWSGPWQGLWETLCHGGLEVNTASYAAVPHLLRIGMVAAPAAIWGYFCFLASIETSRLLGLGPSVPDTLHEWYFEALQRMHEWVCQLAPVPWDYLLTQSAAAALAASKGHAELARAFLELTPDNLRAFSELVEGPGEE